jgi:diaminobutyrate-2-oxoglutarate transaminase
MWEASTDDFLPADTDFLRAPVIRGLVPGPRSRQMLALQARLESNARTYPRNLPIALESGRGATLRDADDNLYIDFFGGAGALAVGHGNRAVTSAAARQQEQLVHALDFPTRTKLGFITRLMANLPGKLRGNARFHFGGPTGSDAVEAALKLVRAHTGRSTVISYHGSYHGMTAGASAVSGAVATSGLGSHNSQFLPYPYCYRCPLGLSHPSCALACAKLLDATLSDPTSGGADAAAVLIEPVQGEGGTIVPPLGYLQEVRRITRRHRVPLIVDEIQTGFARTGSMFACEREEVTPDVIVLSKALGGGGFPLSAIAFAPQLDSWAPGSHIGTFRGHQVGMAAGTAALDYILAHDLAQRADDLGRRLLADLEAARESTPSLGDIRGLGLMLGLEIVRFDGRPWPELAVRSQRLCLERGLIVEIGGHYGNVVRFLPPLIISRELSYRGLEIFRTSLRAAERTRRKSGRVHSRPTLTRQQPVNGSQ